MASNNTGLTSPPGDIDELWSHWSRAHIQTNHLSDSHIHSRVVYSSSLHDKETVGSRSLGPKTSFFIYLFGTVEEPRTFSSFGFVRIQSRLVDASKDTLLSDSVSNIR